jgi:hypothetical protein
MEWSKIEALFLEALMRSSGGAVGRNAMLGTGPPGEGQSLRLYPQRRELTSSRTKIRLMRLRGDVLSAESAVTAR